MKDLLQFIAAEITGNKDIRVEEATSQDLKIYTIFAPREVIGMLIGKEGRTIRAIRALARARAIADQEKVAVKLEELP